MDALERAHRDASELQEREHVTLHMYRDGSKFRCRQILPPGSYELSQHRWTLDTLEDYCFLSAVFNNFGSKAGTASMCDILDLIRI